MAISAVVVTLHSDPQRRELALERLASDPRVTLGPSNGDRIAAVLESDPGRERDLWHDVQDAPGVTHLDLACVFLDEDDKG